MLCRHFLNTFIATLAAPTIADAQGRATRTVIPEDDLPILDPVFTTATVVRNHGYLVFDTLYGMDASFQMLVGHVIEDDGKR